ncbi:MAG: TetR/AcrR family transcriptional regulator [Clostridia bacterium]|nr:TetR/AcrR family transcriptional regulator [Clostridia bacterium]MBQ8446374.1 TetR/AcrR family transcriptional regulator [Clostridia bacterium]
MKNETRKKDRRVIRTQRSIRNALAQLLVEKDVEKISIKEIAERADVDRKTVYNYYSSVYEILAELENDWVEDFDQFTKRLENVRGTEYLEQFFPVLAELIADDIELYKQLMRMGSQSRVINRLTEFLNEKIKKAFARSYELEEEQVNLAAEFVLAGLFWSYRSWFNSDRKKSLKEFSTELGELVMGGLTAYFAE